MFINSALKWFSYIFTGAVLLFIVISIILSLLLNHEVPVNQSTKTCLVTGASSGIGAEISKEMVKRGWKVIGVARRENKLKELENELGAQLFIPVVCNVANQKQIHDASESIKALGLKPTLFFLNAATAELEQKWQNFTDIHQRTFATNYFGTIAWVEEWLLSVKQFGGGIFVATASVQALLATPGAAAYTTSKSALVHWVESFRRQYLYDNIGFSVILPGPVDTEGLKGDVRNLPFIHHADEEARYIIDSVLSGKKRIEPSWFYSNLFRILNWLPDKIMLKLL